MPHFQSNWFTYSFIHISRSPQLRSSPKNTGGKKQSLSTGPHADKRPTWNWVRPDSPRGSFTTLLLTTPVPCSLQDNTFHLGLGRPEPR
jgi:hypothetical protein